MSDTQSLSLTPTERRASFALAGLFAARMLGLFLLLPVLAVAALGVAGGDDPAQVGLALGMYGLTQACMQIPLVWRLTAGGAVLWCWWDYFCLCWAV